MSGTVAPIRNPVDLNIGNTQGNPNDEAASQHAAQTLDPGAVGAGIQTQMNNVRTEASHAAGAAAHQAVQPLLGELQAMKAEMQQMQSAPQQQGPSLEDKYAYTEQDREELGDNLGNIIDKRGQYHSERMLDAALDRIDQLIDSKIQPLSKSLEGLEASRKIQEQKTASDFDNDVMNVITASGIDPNTLQNDNDWHAFRAETYDEIMGTTYGQLLNHAYNTQNDGMVGKVMQRFVNKYKSQNQQQTVMPAGGGGRQQPGLDMGGQQDARMGQIQKEMADLREKAKRRQISQADYAAGINKLSSELEKLNTTTE